MSAPNMRILELQETLRKKASRLEAYKEQVFAAEEGVKREYVSSITNFLQTFPFIKHFSVTCVEEPALHRQLYVPQENRRIKALPNAYFESKAGLALNKFVPHRNSFNSFGGVGGISKYTYKVYFGDVYNSQHGSLEVTRFLNTESINCLKYLDGKEESSTLSSFLKEYKIPTEMFDGLFREFLGDLQKMSPSTFFGLASSGHRTSIVQKGSIELGSRLFSIGGRAYGENEEGLKILAVIDTIPTAVIDNKKKLPEEDSQYHIHEYQVE